jgi:hypothetical protein
VRASYLHTHGLKERTSTAEHTGFPRAMFDGLYALTPGNGLCCPRCQARTGGPDGRQDRGTRSTRFRRPLRAFRPVDQPLDAAAAIASRAQRYVTIAQTPLSKGHGTGGLYRKSEFGSSEIWSLAEFWRICFAKRDELAPADGSAAAGHL